MSEIIIKITISEDEYKHWNSFEKSGVDGVKAELKKDFRDACDSLGIEHCKIEILNSK